MAVEAEYPFPSGITSDSAAITSGTTVVMVAIEAATVADTAAMVMAADMAADMATVADMRPFMATLRSIRFTRPPSTTADVTATERSLLQSGCSGCSVRGHMAR